MKEEEIKIKKKKNKQIVFAKAEHMTQQLYSLDVYPTEIDTYDHQETGVYIAVLFLTAPNWKLPNATNNRRDQEVRNSHQMEYNLAMRINNLGLHAIAQVFFQQTYC